MTKLNLIAMAMLAISSAAFADGSAPAISEFQHQADAGKWEVTPGFTFGSIKSTLSAANSGGYTSGTDSMFNFMVKGEYGINEMLSVGINLGYGSDSLNWSPDQGTGSNSAKVSGMVDPSLFVNGRNDLGSGWLRWGANLYVPVQKGKISSDANGNNETANEATSGFTFAPYVGYEMNLGPGILGANLSYEVLKTNANFDFNTNGSSGSGYTKNGQILAFNVFWEMNFNPVIWGVDVGILNHAGSSEVADGVTTDNKDSFTSFNIHTYANWMVAQDISILPSVGFGTTRQAIQAQINPGNTGQSGIYATVAARFAF